MAGSVLTTSQNHMVDDAFDTSGWDPGRDSWRAPCHHADEAEDGLDDFKKSLRTIIQPGQDEPEGHAQVSLVRAEEREKQLQLPAGTAQEQLARSADGARSGTARAGGARGGAGGAIPGAK